MADTKYTISLVDRVSNKAKTMQGSLDKVDKSAAKSAKSIDSMSKVAGALSVGAVVAFGTEALKAAAKYESLNKAISFASGSDIEAKLNLSFLDKQADDLGIKMDALAGGFKTFSGAMRGTKFNARQQRDMFLKVSKATKVMQLSGDDAKGVFLALGQMMSKGKVTAEELRGQIGERIPGAFQIAADAIGVTTAQLDKMMSSGELIAEDFLPKFANQLDKEFAGGVSKATESISSDLARLENTWDKLLTNMGKRIHESGILDKMSTMLSSLNKEEEENALRSKYMSERLGIGQQHLTREDESFFQAHLSMLDSANKKAGLLNEKYQKLSESEQKSYKAKTNTYFNKLIAGEYKKYKFEQPLAITEEGQKRLQNIRKQIEYYKQLKELVQGFEKSTTKSTIVETATSESTKEAKKAEGVVSGGIRQFNINIDKLTGIDTLTTNTVEDGAENAGRIVIDEIIEALADTKAFQ